MELKEMINEDLRLAILCCLEEAPGYTMNDSMLHTYLLKIGCNHPRDKVRTEANWLSEQGLVTLGGIENVMVITLTERGLDVRHARAKVPGVKRPSPK